MTYIDINMHMHINQCCIVIHWEQLPSWVNVWWHRADTAVRPRGSQCNPGEMWPLLSCRERPWRPKESVSSQRLSRTDSCEAAAPACQWNSRSHTVRACDCERQPFPTRKGRRADAWISFSTFFFFSHLSTPSMSSFWIGVTADVSRKESLYGGERWRQIDQCSADTAGFSK